eukprot:366497-Chlamydomonas_euryale.AAC.3
MGTQPPPHRRAAWHRVAGWVDLLGERGWRSCGFCCRCCCCWARVAVAGLPPTSGARDALSVAWAG